MKKIWDYFVDNYDYPNEVAHNPIPYGTVWCYISATFLNGFINYVKPIKWYVIDRYTPDDNDLTSRNIKYQYKETHKEIIFEGTKFELKNKILSSEFEMYHTDLKLFNDDIIILAEIGTNYNDIGIGIYMFFYYDYDVSDCCIGKFQTEDSKEAVIKSITNWLEEEKNKNKDKNITEYDNGIVNYTELPIDFLKGWLKF